MRAEGVEVQSDLPSLDCLEEKLKVFGVIPTGNVPFDVEALVGI